MKKINNCSNGGGYFRRTVNKKIIVPLIGIITLIILVIGISYAAFTYSGIGEKENVITTGTITMAYNEGSNGISLSNAIPTSDEVGKELTGENNEFDFTVNINIVGKTTINYEVTAEKQDGSTLQDNEVRIYLEKSTENENNYQAVDNPSYYEPLADKDQFGAKRGEMVLDVGSANETTIYYYKLRMWIADTYELTEEKKTFTIKVNVYGSDGVIINAAEHFNKPQLVGDMIPVKYNGTKWVKANKENSDNDWYDYDKQIWANAVTIKEAEKREEYKSAAVGAEINLEDVNLMLVWIPRYSYTLKSPYGTMLANASEPSQATPGAFDIKFVDTNTIETGSGHYIGETAKNYYTPSSFCWGDTCDTTRSDEGNKELPGIWISKFELTGTIENIESKPNVESLRNQTNQAFFDAIQTQMNNENGSTKYGLSGENYDTHMIKNTEWGAMAYLSQSKYGKYGNSKYINANKEIYINDYYNNGTLTGCSKGEPGSGSSSGSNKSDTCKHQYNEETTGTGASTTGTIYGIYDTVGGTWDRVMGYLSESDLTKSGFESNLAGIDKKYYNLYTGTTGIKGDATNADGTAGFYRDFQSFVSSSNPWFSYGGHYGDGLLAGIFYFTSGSGGTGVYGGSRAVLSIW